MMPHTPRPAEAIAADRARYEEHQRKGLTFAPKALPLPKPPARPRPGRCPLAARDHRRLV